MLCEKICAKLLTALLGFCTALGCCAVPAAAAQAAAAPPAAVHTLAVPAAVTAAIADPARPPAQVVHDAERRPGEVLAFAGIRRGDRIGDFIASHTPAVVVYDLEPPYGLSAARFLSLLDRFSECSFVITCADRALALHSAPWLSAVPVFQKPYVLDEIADSVYSRVTRISLKLAPVYLGI